MEEERNKILVELPEELLNTPIEKLQLSTHIKRSFQWHGVNTFRELLAYDYDKILKFRQFGDKYLKELRDFVHSLGLTLKGEYKSIEELAEEKRKQNIILLDTYGFSKQLCFLLYNNDIFTLEDLINYGTKVYAIGGMNKTKAQELMEKLEQLGINLKENKEEILPSGYVAVEIRATLNDKNVKPSRIVDPILRKSYERKQELLAEYKRLLIEKHKIHEREKELDNNIKQILQELGIVDEVQKGRR